ncbi:acyl-CoA dehydrogenase C-terminal domain-containing protein [Pseudomarimonas salicorniae]|uniref:Acyl-CoA dehydrogenase C-terminal domain-containing protein n=1 Tax=Pseudomarimonas salicorniae TaxID=2933270 RepID=A0ABT0GH55_9GAMM|nr:acyl-CoA dehydrogenase C-terminal domain-containing protein [Lysobacter sp. CAU 1642]MCK7593687.1 acyl-CoA dehydrogenase C-terminal domain-containing protein [Lysobacter sp. CAU 1642]
MNSYKAPVKDMRFALLDVLDVEPIYQRIGAEQATRDIIEAVLEEGARFNESVLAPLNQSGDQEGCHFDKATGKVTTPKGFKEAYAQFVEGGWPGLTAPEQFGGQHLPESLGAAIKEMIDAANLAWGNYPLLSHGATEALKHHGEDWQQEVFLKPIVEGRWTGTMCLTEPHCGSDLGLLKTRAEPQADGTYAIHGTKIFITAGEHDLTENIVHLVLARLPDAPPGTKGISLFIVPKIRTAKDGTLGEPNALRCGSIEHKMGIHASATCVMNFDGAEGYLIGQPNKGLNAMFTMMNTARLAVGIQGLGLIDRAYQNALAYSRDRLQMRSLSGSKRPDKPADPLIVHPDIRRMLLTCKALGDGSRLLALHAALQVDLLERSPDEAERKKADELLGFLTPIVKACLTEWSVECTYHALQCFGGHGYVQEWGMEQLARDARITTIYEGTTGIQALDLLGRKVIQLQGAGLKHFLGLIVEFCSAQTKNAELVEFVAPLAQAAQDWQQLTMDIGKRLMENPEELGAASVDYLFYSGYVTLAYWWTRAVEAADRSGDKALAEQKRAVARFYFQRILPRTLSHASAIRSGAASLMALPEEAFAA